MVKRQTGKKFSEETKKKMRESAINFGKLENKI